MPDNCAKCGADIKNLSKYKTKLGVICDFCYCKYILKTIKPNYETWFHQEDA